MKRSIIVILTIALMLAFTATSLGLTSIAVRSIKLTSANVKIQVGKTYTLKVTITPANATNKKLTFSSGNKNIATVDKNGKIKGIKAGKTVITVTSASNNKAVAKCNVTISQVAEKVELQYMFWMATVGKHPDNIIAAFQKKYPNITVIPQAGSGDVATYKTQQKMRLLSGDVGLTTIRSESIQELADEGLILDITDQDFLKKYNPDAVQAVKRNGRVYSAPEFQSVIGVYYNKDIFKKNNWVIPKDFNSLIALCDKIKAAGMDPFLVGGNSGWPMEFGLVYPILHKILVNDNAIFDKLAKGEVKYTDPLFVDAFKKIDSLFKKGYPPKNDLSISFQDSKALFLQGKIPMWITGDWMSTQVASGGAEFEVGVFPIPYNDPGKEIVVPRSVISSLAIAKKSKSQDAALKYIEFVSEVENATIVSSSMGAFYTVKGLKSDFNPIATLFDPMHQMKSVDFFYSIMNQAANAEMLKGLQSLLAGTITPEDLCKAMQAKQELSKK